MSTSYHEVPCRDCGGKVPSVNPKRLSLVNGAPQCRSCKQRQSHRDTPRSGWKNPKSTATRKAISNGLKAWNNAHPKSTTPKARPIADPVLAEGARRQKLREARARQVQRGAHQGYKWSIEARQRLSESLRKNPRRYWLGKKRPDMTGPKSHFWKGGVTEANQIIRTSTEYKAWRLAVFRRDRFACIQCGHKGKDIEADHIKKFSDFPELRLDISNGQTLCYECHLVKTGDENRKERAA